MTRTIVIGDIHGCFDELVSLLELINLGPQDRVVAVGDLVVKGPKSRQVLDLFRSDSRFSSVIGNHDLALRRFWSGESVELKASQKRAADQMADDWQIYFNYLETLPMTIDLANYLVVHAGIRPGVSLDRQTIEDATALRTLGPDRTSREGIPWFEVYDGPQTVLFGHWPSGKPRIGRKAIGLDTGCVYGYSLTGYIVETQEFVSVPARAVYDRPKF